MYLGIHQCKRMHGTRDWQRMHSWRHDPIARKKRIIERWLRGEKSLVDYSALSDVTREFRFIRAHSNWNLCIQYPFKGAYGLCAGKKWSWRWVSEQKTKNQTWEKRNTERKHCAMNTLFARIGLVRVSRLRGGLFPLFASFAVALSLQSTTGDRISERPSSSYSILSSFFVPPLRPHVFSFRCAYCVLSDCIALYSLLTVAMFSHFFGRSSL